MRVRSTDDESDDIMGMPDFLDFDSTTETFLENDMTAVKKATPAKTVKTKAPAEATTTVKTKGGKAAPAAAPAEKAKGVFGPRVVPEGYIGLNALAEEAGIKPAAARRKLRGLEGMTKPEGQHGWYWKDGSKDLAKVRAALKQAE